MNMTKKMIKQADQADEKKKKKKRKKKDRFEDNENKGTGVKGRMRKLIWRKGETSPTRQRCVRAVSRCVLIM